MICLFGLEDGEISKMILDKIFLEVLLSNLTLMQMVVKITMMISDAAFQQALKDLLVNYDPFYV